MNSQSTKYCVISSWNSDQQLHFVNINELFQWFLVAANSSIHQHLTWTDLSSCSEQFGSLLCTSLNTISSFSFTRSVSVNFVFVCIHPCCQRGRITCAHHSADKERKKKTAPCKKGTKVEPPLDTVKGNRQTNCNDAPSSFLPRLWPSTMSLMMVNRFFGKWRGDGKPPKQEGQQRTKQHSPHFLVKTSPAENRRRFHKYTAYAR